MQEKTIGELFEEEKVSLLPLPQTEFETRRTEIHTADSLSLVRFDRNDYSVPGDHAHKEFTVVGSIDTVRFLADGGVVAEHERDWGVKKTHYNPIHYLSIAERRPNGLDFGAPFAAWHLPHAFDVLRRRLEEQAGKQGKREYIRILRLLEHFTLEQLSCGIERALASNTTAYEGVRLYVECAATAPVELFSLDGRPHLQQVHLPEPDIHRYATLLERNPYEETRNETDSAFEASFTAVETAAIRAGMRGDGVPLCEGEHRSSGIPAPVGGAGIAGSGIHRLLSRKFSQFILHKKHKRMHSILFRPLPRVNFFHCIGIGIACFNRFEWIINTYTILWQIVVMCPYFLQPHGHCYNMRIC